MIPTAPDALNAPTPLRRRGEAAHDDAGTMTLWLLGLSLALLALGGISVDLWRVVAQRQVLAAAVDAAAAAGAAALDVDVLRSTEHLQLDPAAAESAALAALTALDPAGMTAATVAATPEAVLVAAEAEVALTLLRIVVAGAAPVSVRAEAVAMPRASP